MSGLIAITIASLLLQEPAPHPSTQGNYQAPLIRPFEPGVAPDRARAQGDAGAERQRRPLETPVTVEAYVRSYEYAPTDAETAYEQGVTAAEIRADQTAGRLDGLWWIVDAAGRTLYELVLNDPGVGPIEGGWRGRSRVGSSPATSDGTTLTLEGAGVVALERSEGGWRGTLNVEARARSVSLVRPN